MSGAADLDALQAENEELRQELEECRQLVVQVMQAEDQGRRRIAQLIHDDSLQTLLAANQELIEAAPGRAQVTRAHEVVEGAIARLREAMMALHPVTLEEGGFEQALGAVARQAARQGGFEVATEIDREAIDANDEMLLAVARELLTNTARHSGATAVSVSLARAGDQVELDGLRQRRRLSARAARRGARRGPHRARVGRPEDARRGRDARGNQLGRGHDGARRGGRGGGF